MTLILDRENFLDSDRPIVLFGAGEAGYLTCTLLRGALNAAGRLAGFIDSNPAKQGSVFSDLPVYGPNDRSLIELKPLVVLCARNDQGNEQMRAACRKIGLACIDHHALRGAEKKRVSFDLSRPPYSSPFPNTALCVDIVNKCNINCVNCPALLRLTQNEPFYHMPETVFHQIVDRAVGQGFKSIGFFFRGEPFLHDGIDRFAAYATSRGLKLFLSSNLSLPNIPALIPTLVHCDNMTVSVSGFTQATHQKNHCGSDIAIVKAHLEEISQAKASGLVQGKVVIKYLNFGYNRLEIEVFRKYAVSLDLEFMDVFGAAVDSSAARDFDAEDGRIFAASVDEYAGLRRNSLFAQCSYRDQGLIMDHHANVYLCCLKWSGGIARIGNFLTDDFAQLQLLRQTHPYCAVCGLEMKAVPDSGTNRTQKKDIDI